VVPLPRSEATIPWHRRLEAQVAAGLTAIAGISLVALLAATSEVVSTRSLARSNADLAAALAAFNHLVEARTEAAAKETRLVVELPTFRVVLTDINAARDSATMTDMVDEYRQKLGAAFCLVSDRDGRSLGQAGLVGSENPTAVLMPVVSAARSGRSASEIVTMGGALFLVVAEPARFAEEILGTLTVGFRLDDDVARELAVVTHGEVSFVCGGARLCGSSLAPETRAALAGLLDAGRASFGGVGDSPVLRQIGRTSYVGALYSLRPNAPAESGLVLLQDWTATAQTLRGIRLALGAVGAVTFGIALIAAVVFSRRLTRPLRHLAAAADHLAGGRWSQRLAVEGPAEARMMACAFNDMTVSLSHWHEQAEQRTGQLGEAYERFRSVTDSVNDAIVSITTRGEIVFWNLRAEAIFGYSEREALGQSIGCLLPERHRARLADALERLAAGDDQWLGRPIEADAARRDGSEVPIELSLSTWRTGTEIFYTGVMRDNTERRQAAEALRLREEQLRQAQKMEAVGRLAGGVAHDFNNLLTAILGYADLLVERLDVDQPIRKQVVEIQKAGRSAASLTRDLLAFSRKQVRQPVPLDLNGVIAHAENLLRRLIGEHIDLVIAPEPGLLAVKADPSQIQQVLVNLAVNARDAMPQGGRLTMTTANLDAAAARALGAAPSAHGPQVALMVTDTGSGISEDVRPHIFEPFFTTKNVGQGTGLGLATVYGIVSQNDGQICVSSAAGRGSTFTVVLPAAQASAEPITFVSEVSDSSYRGSETVLVVEDNPSVRAMTCEALDRYGYHVIAAGNGQDALRLPAESLGLVAIVVTDVVMPLVGGRELARRLRALRPDLRFVFVSGYASDPEGGWPEIEPGSAFLQKPFGPALLSRTIREVLDAGSLCT
jgi:PAS domain S-box-containing protein